MENSILEPMKVVKVDARRNPSITFNEVMSKPLNNAPWIDTTSANEDFDRVQQENLNQGYHPKTIPNLQFTPARIAYFGFNLNQRTFKIFDEL